MIVLDADAQLALVKDEAGADALAREAGSDDGDDLGGGHAETLQKAAQSGAASMLV